MGRYLIYNRKTGESRCFTGSVINLYSNIEDFEETIKIPENEYDTDYKIEASGVTTQKKITRIENNVFINLKKNAICTIDDKTVEIPENNGRIQIISMYSDTYFIELQNQGIQAVCQLQIIVSKDTKITGDPIIYIDKNYQTKRMAAYPGIEDQIGALYETIGLDNLNDEALHLYKKVLEIKKKYPKSTDVTNCPSIIKIDNAKHRNPIVDGVPIIDLKVNH